MSYRGFEIKDIEDWIHNREQIIRYMILFAVDINDAREIFDIINKINSLRSDILKKHCEEKN